MDNNNLDYEKYKISYNVDADSRVDEKIIINDNTNSISNGHGYAVASLVLGIISLVSCLSVILAIVSFITGMIGIVCANHSSKIGFKGGIKTGGLVCSIIGTVLSTIIIVIALSLYACVNKSYNQSYEKEKTTYEFYYEDPFYR